MCEKAALSGRAQTKAWARSMRFVGGVRHRTPRKGRSRLLGGELSFGEAERSAVGDGERRSGQCQDHASTVPRANERREQTRVELWTDPALPKGMWITAVGELGTRL